MHHADPQVRLLPSNPMALAFCGRICPTRRNRAGRGQNFAVGAIVNGAGAANALKTFAPCKAAAHVLRLSRHTTLLAGVALAAAVRGHRGLGDQDAWAMDETTGRAGS